MAKLTSKGAAGVVTGSEHYLEVGTGDDKIELLIDAGMFQGKGVDKIDPTKNWFESQLEGPDGHWNETNRVPNGVPYQELDAVMLTHAHFDHSGKLGYLIHEGFAGEVVGTPASLELAKEINADSARIQEQECERVNELRPIKQKGWTKEPMYGEQDIYDLAGQFHPIDRGEVYTLEKGDNRVTAVFQNAGHIGGSSSVQLFIEEGEKLTYMYVTGDLGKGGHPILKDPEYKPLRPEDVGIHKDVTENIMLIESTYGAREHQDKSDTSKLADVLNSAYQNAQDTSGRRSVLKGHQKHVEARLAEMEEKLRHARGGRERRAIIKEYGPDALNDQLEVSKDLLSGRGDYPLGAEKGHVLIPVFSVDRLQEVAWDIIRLQKEGQIPKDVSLVIDSSLGEAATEIYSKHREEYSDKTNADLKRFGMKHIFDSPNIYLARDIDDRNGPPRDDVKIVLAASGMITGGKSPFYASRVLMDPSATVITVGYQGDGTPGRSLLDGEDTVSLRFNKPVGDGPNQDMQYIRGTYPVHSETAALNGLYSGHADMSDLDERVDTYADFVSKEYGQTPNVHLVHGDPDQLEAFHERLAANYGDTVDVAIQERDVSYDI